jgi:cytochrome c biogenesis protein CcmG/thiol:disulfide interchange protein DsbE
MSDAVDSGNVHSGDSVPENDAPGWNDQIVDHDQVGQASGTIARTIGGIVGVIVLAMIALLALGGGGDDNETNRLLGQRVPVVAGLAVDGTDFDIDDRRGEWVLINFFGTWCPPCVAEHPELVALETWGADNERLSLMSVAFNEPGGAEAVAKFFDDFGGSWPVLDDANLSVEFQISQVPESFLVAPSGLVVQHFTGGIRAEDVKASIIANDLPASQGGVGEG